MAVKPELFRIIDANFNRSREGLRVCEDIARFIMNSKPLTRELKNVRHRVSSVVRGSPAMARTMLASRRASDDVGKLPQLGIELSRKDYVDIFIANMQRVKESLRVLEEFFKLIDISLSVKLLQARFKVYEIEKKAVMALSRGRHHRRVSRA